MKKSPLLIAALALCLPLSACSSATGPASPTKESRQSAAAPQSDQSAPAGQQSDGQQSTELQSGPKLGQTYTWDDGLAVTVGTPEDYQPSEIIDEEYHLEAGTPLKFQVTIDNGTDQQVDSSQLMADLVSGGEPAERVEDPDQGITLPAEIIEPGASLSFAMVFIVPDPATFDITWYDLTLAREKVVFSK